MTIPGSDAGVKELRLASWDTRFWAWLIDVILIGIISTLLRQLMEGLHLPLPHIPGIDWTGPFLLPGSEVFSLSSVLLFLYWTIMEWQSGQSIGKMVMNIRVTDREGDPIGLGCAAIESFGKAFILIPDCLIGWLAMSGKKMRLFNRVSNTLVIVSQYTEPKGVRYVIDTAE